ncbi:hypothetical protein PCASD_05883 [Puccinia coronata f. sp. avenae]|uniref:Uncharacterized protein n=1 Tax=Puccinia coronata f. sp. avenae TaxID=200324 RepID=A0A2N5V3Y7_9BASI|nr:hypothetical protein PCASD_05883 [Puccinia coronata f. sp. avenae]
MGVLPHFAPKKLPPPRRSIKDSDIPHATGQLLKTVYTIIHNRPRHFTPTQLQHHKHWWKLSAHRTATRWSLYRNLIRHANWFEQQQTSLPNHRGKLAASSSSTPVLTDWIREEFRQYRTLRTVPHTQEVLRQGYILLTQLVNAKFGSSDDLQQLQEQRQELVDIRQKKVWAKVYRKQLESQRPRTPIMTGRFLRPSILNGPLPRLAHQPLHISMMMSSRRKARERRMAEHRHLKEKLDTIRQEHQFEAALGQDQRDLFHQEHNAEVRGILDRLNVIDHSFTLEKERERVRNPLARFLDRNTPSYLRVYSRELLDKIEAARRRRPVVMAQRNRWKRTKTRLAELEYATQDDPLLAPDTPEAKCARLPEPSFWTS